MRSVVAAVGFGAPEHVGSAWTRDQTCVLCIARHILTQGNAPPAPPFLSLS